MSIRIGATLLRPMARRSSNTIALAATKSLQLSAPGNMLYNLSRGREARLSRQAHNLKIVGSNPTPATNL